MSSAPSARAKFTPPLAMHRVASSAAPQPTLLPGLAKAVPAAAGPVDFLARLEILEKAVEPECLWGSAAPAAAPQTALEMSANANAPPSRRKSKRQPPQSRREEVDDVMSSLKELEQEIDRARQRRQALAERNFTPPDTAKTDA